MTSFKLADELLQNLSVLEHRSSGFSKLKETLQAQVYWYQLKVLSHYTQGEYSNLFKFLYQPCLLTITTTLKRTDTQQTPCFDAVFYICIPNAVNKIIEIGFADRKFAKSTRKTLFNNQYIEKACFIFIRLDFPVVNDYH